MSYGLHFAMSNVIARQHAGLRRCSNLALYSLALQSRCPPPFLAVLWITDLCNAQCAMCGIWRTKPKRSIEPALLGRTMQNSRYLRQAPIYVLTGGEPLLHPAFSEITTCLDEYAPYQFRAATNGIGTTIIQRRIEEVLRDCSAPFSLKLSLDTLDATLFDRIRGTRGGLAHWFETLAVLRELRRAAPQRLLLTLGVTVMHENIGELDRLLDFAIEHDLDFFFKPVQAAITLHYPEIECGVALTQDDWRRYNEFLIRMKNYYMTHGLIARKLYLAYLEVMEGLYAGRPYPYDPGFHSSVHIDPAGNVFTDMALQQVRGNIADRDFDELWQELNADYRGSHNQAVAADQINLCTGDIVPDLICSRLRLRR